MNCECMSYEFKCKDGSGCIATMDQCNDYEDCDDGSDEDPSVCSGGGGILIEE